MRLAAVNAHQVVLQRKEKSSGARIALATRSAAKLIVDSSAVVPLGADDVQATHLRDRPAFFLHLLGLLDLLDLGFPDVFGHVEPGRIFVPEHGPRHRLRIAAEDDVGAAAGHVGGDGDGLLAAGLGDDLGFAGHVFRLGVEQLVIDAAALEHRGQLFGLLDRCRADQDRLAGLVDSDNFLDDRFPLFRLITIDQVRMIDAWSGLLVGMAITSSL